MNTRYVLGAAFLSLAAASSARANLLINGGLELPSNTPLNQYNFLTLKPGDTTLTGWSITKGTVDVVPSAGAGTAYWENTEGNFSLDLVGTPGVGGISQHVTTTAHTTYTLTFDFSVNPEVGFFLDESASTKILRVQAVTSSGTILASQDYSDTAGTRTFQDMQWSNETFTFTAPGTGVTLKLTALTPTNLPSGATASKIYTGPVIDNLDLEPGGGSQVPEPASLGLMGAGTTTLMLRRRRKAA